MPRGRRPWHRGHGRGHALGGSAGDGRAPSARDLNLVRDQHCRPAGLETIRGHCERSEAISGRGWLGGSRLLRRLWLLSMTLLDPDQKLHLEIGTWLKPSLACWPKASKRMTSTRSIACRGRAMSG